MGPGYDMRYDKGGQYKGAGKPMGCQDQGFLRGGREGEVTRRTMGKGKTFQE